MSGPKGTVDYQGYSASQANAVPDTETRGDYFNEHATPNAFGANVGEATEGLGKTGQDVAQKYQGMINETMATNAETSYMEDLGKSTAKFRSLEGLAAVAAAPAYTAEVAGLRQKYRGTLPMAAGHAFDMLAQRHEAYAINDANLYAAGQVKAADKASAQSQVQVSVANAGNLSVAQDDKRFNDTLQDINFGQGRMMQNGGWDAGTGMKQGADGSLSFDETSDNGKKAKFTYDEMANKNISQAWENRYKTLAENGPILDAYNGFKANYDKMPPNAQLKLDQYFAPKISDSQSRTISQNVLSDATSGYHEVVYGKNTNSFNIGNVKTADGAASGTARFVQPASAEDGVIIAANNLRNNYQGLTIEQIGNKWAPPSENTTSDWVKNVSAASGMAPDTVPNLNDPAQLKALVKGIGVAEKAPKDMQNFTDDVITSGVTKSLSGTKANTAPVVASPNGAMVPSISDYYKTNYANILQKSRDQAEQMKPGDIEFAEKTEARTKQQVDAIIKQQKEYDEANQDTVTKAATGGFSKDGVIPQTIDQLTQTSPDVAKAWESLTINNPKAAAAIQNKLVGAKQDGKLGSGFSYLQQQAYQGKLTKEDLLYHVGDDLTQEGFKSLSTTIKATPTSNDRSDADQMATFLKYGHERILHSSLFNNTPEAEQAYQNWFSNASKAIQDGKDKQIPLSSMLDPSSKDYVGGNMHQFLVPMHQQLQDRAQRINEKINTIGPLPQDRMRQPGETPEAYLARVK